MGTHQDQIRCMGEMETKKQALIEARLVLQLGPISSLMNMDLQRNIIHNHKVIIEATLMTETN